MLASFCQPTIRNLFNEITYKTALSLGQTDLQVVASGRKFNLRRDFRWVAKRTRKFPHKYTQVAKKAF